jgi:glycopeptide antibiotics resistance protein
MRERFRLAHVVWGVTTLFIIFSTAAPFHFDTSLQSVSAHLSRIRLNPLISPDTGRRISIPDFVQNLLLFVPFGAAAVSAFGGDRSLRHIRSAVLLGCALSVGAESVQLLTTDRISSFADVLSNTAGALTGAMIASISRRRHWSGFVSRANTGVAAAPTYRAVLATAFLVCIASWEPFDVTLDVGVVAGHLKALRAGLWQESFSADHLIVFVLFLLFGFMLTQWLRELHVRFPVTAGIAAAMTAGIALEASQIFIESRLPTVAGGLANAAGGVAGALVSALEADVRSKLRVLTFVCLLAAGVATVQWISGREAGLSALRDIGLCLVGAYVGVWSAARTLPIRRTDH